LGSCPGLACESLSQPGKVRFVADIINHVLHWTPGVNHSSDTLYEVEYKLYGKSPWMAVPDCTGISGDSCNLTYQTMDPSQRYYARVRAVSGNCNLWLDQDEPTLRLSDVSLSVTDNTIHVSLQQLILRVGNETVSYKDMQKYGRQYRTYVKRASDNLQVRQPALERRVDIPMLLWGEQYCVSVEPRVLSRPVPAIRTKEKCVTIPKKDGNGHAGSMVCCYYLGGSELHPSLGRATYGDFPACSSGDIPLLHRRAVCEVLGAPQIKGSCSSEPQHGSHPLSLRAPCVPIA
uniref:Fibronectin type-III domain-containing protein n=1 Tax=Gopherus evgoodei TaxID=1825980 RepID=A0A8C4YQ85_9SAUR